MARRVRRTTHSQAPMAASSCLWLLLGTRGPLTVAGACLQPVAGYKASGSVFKSASPPRDFLWTNSIQIQILCAFYSIKIGDQFHFL
jgi:hypothetical protein